MEDDRRFLEAQLKAAKAKLKNFHSDSYRDELKTPDSFITQREAITPIPNSNRRNFVPTTRVGLIIFEMLNRYPIKDGQFLVEIEKYMNNQERQYQESIKHFKNTLDNEKRKILTVKTQQNSVFTEKQEAESLFLDCVEEVRKEVHRRKAKSLLQQKFGRQIKSAHKLSQKEAFTPHDKRKILELLISNEQVLIMLYEKLFPHKASQFNSPKTEKEEIGDSKILNIEEMLKQVPVKYPDDKFTSSFQPRGRSLMN